jgi:hypothetical protein
MNLFHSLTFMNREMLAYFHGNRVHNSQNIQNEASNMCKIHGHKGPNFPTIEF